MNDTLAPTLLVTARNRQLTAAAAVTLWELGRTSGRSSVVDALLSNPHVVPLLAEQWSAGKISAGAAELGRMVAHTGADWHRLLLRRRSASFGVAAEVAAAGLVDDTELEHLYRRFGHLAPFCARVLSQTTVPEPLRGLVSAEPGEVVLHRKRWAEAQIARIGPLNPWWLRYAFETLQGAQKLETRQRAALRLVAHSVAVHDRADELFADLVDVVVADRHRFGPASITAARTNPHRAVNRQRSRPKVFGGHADDLIVAARSWPLAALPKITVGSWLERFVVTRRADDFLCAVTRDRSQRHLATATRIPVAVSFARSFDDWDRLIGAVRPMIGGDVVSELLRRRSSGRPAAGAGRGLVVDLGDELTDDRQWDVLAGLVGTWSGSAADLAATARVLGGDGAQIGERPAA